VRAIDDLIRRYYAVSNPCITPSQRSCIPARIAAVGRPKSTAEGRQRRTAVWIAVIAAVGAVFAAVLSALIAARCPALPATGNRDRDKTATSEERATQKEPSVSSENHNLGSDGREVSEPSDGVVDDVWEVATVTGADDAGHIASFRFLVVSRAFEWKFASSDTVIRNGKEQDFTRHLRTPGIQATMSRARALIAVGASSQEGDNRAREEKRALERADQIELWLSEYVTTDVPLDSLTLGHYVGSPLPATEHQTGIQRRLVVVAVKDHEPTTNIEKALKSAIRNNPARFPFTLDDYSRFEMLPRR